MLDTIRIHSTIYDSCKTVVERNIKLDESIILTTNNLQSKGNMYYLGPDRVLKQEIAGKFKPQNVSREITCECNIYGRSEGDHDITGTFILSFYEGKLLSITSTDIESVLSSVRIERQRVWREKLRNRTSLPETKKEKESFLRKLFKFIK